MSLSPTYSFFETFPEGTWIDATPPSLSTFCGFLAETVSFQALRGPPCSMMFRRKEDSPPNTVEVALITSRSSCHLILSHFVVV